MTDVGAPRFASVYDLASGLLETICSISLFWECQGEGVGPESCESTSISTSRSITVPHMCPSP